MPLSGLNHCLSYPTDTRWKGIVVREALARADHDFVLSQAPRRKARAVAQEPVRASRLSFLLRRPGRVVLFVISSAMVTGIILNAVLYQSGPHPAPLFGIRQQQAIQAAQVAHAPPPPMRAEAPAPAPQQAMAAPAAVVAPARVAPPREEAPAAVAAPLRRDPIAALLGGEPASPPAARVMAVQKALIKSGFVLKADGQWGVSTREALAGFERERKLPVTGDLSARTLKELSARTGISIP